MVVVRHSRIDRRGAQATKLEGTWGYRSDRDLWTKLFSATGGPPPPTIRDIVRNADAVLLHAMIGCARTVTKGSTMMTTRIRSSRNLRPAVVAAAGIVLSAAFL